MLLIFDASIVCTDICKTLFVISKVQFHHEAPFKVAILGFLATLVALHFTPVSQSVSQPVGRVLEKRSLELASLFVCKEPS